jgi:hypothetical protein
MKLLRELLDSVKDESVEKDDLPKTSDHEDGDGINREELIKEFFSVYKEKMESYSDAETINADFVDFLKSKGITGKLVTGKLELDNPDISEKDFSERQLNFIKKHGYDTSKSEDLMKFCIKNNYFDKIKLVAHSWVRVKRLILDPAGIILFKNTKKVKDLSDDRYNEKREG